MSTKTARILRAAAEAFDVSVPALCSESRTREVAYARQAAAYLLHQQVPGISLTTIGRTLGHRHHTTIMHALAVVPERAERDPLFAEALREAEAALQVQP